MMMFKLALQSSTLIVKIDCEIRVSLVLNTLLCLYQSIVITKALHPLVLMWNYVLLGITFVFFARHSQCALLSHTLDPSMARHKTNTYMLIRHKHFQENKYTQYAYMCVTGYFYEKHSKSHM